MQSRRATATQHAYLNTDVRTHRVPRKNKPPPRVLSVQLGQELGLVLDLLDDMHRLRRRVALQHRMARMLDCAPANASVPVSTSRGLS